MEIGAIARSRLAGISSRYAEIRQRRKRANLNKETANEFSRQAANLLKRFSLASHILPPRDDLVEKKPANFARNFIATYDARLIRIKQTGRPSRADRLFPLPCPDASNRSDTSENPIFFQTKE